MSLLNDMLRDLSNQHNPTEAAAAIQESVGSATAQEQRELFNHTRAAKPLPRTFLPSLVIFVLVLILASLWKTNFFSGVNNRENIGVSKTEANKIQLASVDTSPSSANQLYPTIAVGSIATKANPATSTPLASATQNPDDKSLAPELAERITALESAINNLSLAVANNPASFDSEQAVADPDFAQEVISQQASEAAPPETDSFHGVTNEAFAESVSIREPFAHSLPAQPASEQSYSREPEVGSLEAEQGEPKFSIEPNVKWQDSKIAQQASQLVAQGQTNFAIEKLQSYIATASKPYQSTKALLDIFVAQENVSAMQGVLTQADYLSAVDKTFYSAKIAIIQGREPEAIQQLEVNLAQAENNENYRALLAGLYQRAGMQLEAANHYRRLLSVFGEKPTYWLGFALAQDALDQKAVAVQAYQRVNQYADLQPQVRTYIQQRIAALQ